MIMFDITVTPPLASIQKAVNSIFSTGLLRPDESGNHKNLKFVLCVDLG